MLFNKENKGHSGSSKPLFLGEPLGVMDTINVQYPQLEALYQLQLSQIWNEFEVDLTQDRIQMQKLPRSQVDLMVKTIMWQHVADSVAARSIIETLGKHITNSEMSNLAHLWSFFEVIHARTYSHIIKQTFVEPNEMLEQLYEEAAVMQRSDVIIRTFEEMDLASAKYERGEMDIESLKVHILKTIAALAALESIAFMASFAVTFSLVQRGYFIGIGQLVKLIARDEVIHTRMGFALLNILRKDPAWSDVWLTASFEIENILNAVVEQELAWADYLFSEGREVIGLSAPMLKDYTLYMAAPLYKAFDIPFLYETPKEMPLPYMDKYIDSQKVQAAAQEIQLTNYKVGAVTDDTEGLLLTDEVLGL